MRYGGPRWWILHPLILSQASDPKHGRKEPPVKQTHDKAANGPGPVVRAGPTAEAKRLVGTIKELWRCPVKSMLGGAVSELLVTEHGGLGGPRLGAVRPAERADREREAGPSPAGVPRDIRGGANT